ncbi:hypothetical protein LIER_26777 [Lithospermum erythrorhizon]|uniref:Uncharacterized protein n=1 Tax=Lithospermum erythrorhizon TaxID=34254 RepID=A0AAV3RDN0_LITER
MKVSRVPVPIDPQFNLAPVASNTSNLFHSDHLPLLLKLGTIREGYKKRKPRFRFEEGWCLYDDSQQVVQEAWNSDRGGDPGEYSIISVIVGWVCLNGRGRLWSTTKLEAKQLELNTLQMGNITTHQKW